MGDAVLDVLLSLSLSGGWKQAKSSGNITLVLCGASEWLIATGCLWQAPCPSVCIRARGTSQVLVVHLGCLWGNHVHVYLLVSVFCFLRYAAALSPHYGSKVIALQPPFLPSASQVQTPCLHRHQEVASQVDLKACVYMVLMEPPGKQQ